MKFSGKAGSGEGRLPGYYLVLGLMLELILAPNALTSPVYSITSILSQPDVDVGLMRIRSIEIYNNESVLISMEKMFIYVDNDWIGGVNFQYQLIEPGTSQIFHGTQISVSPGEHKWHAEFFWHEIADTSGTPRTLLTEDQVVYIPSWWDVHGTQAMAIAGLIIATACTLTLLFVTQHLKRKGRKTS